MQLSTANVLHPNQVRETNELKKQLRGIIDSPPHVRNQIQDMKSIRKQDQDADALLKQAPEPIAPGDIDGAVRAERQLRESWLEGMPTQAEMRRNPPGAVDKNIRWNRDKKSDVLRWKNLRRRLQATGMDLPVNDVSNVELYRPVDGSMNMDNAQIEGKDLKIPSFDNGLPVVFNDEDKAVIEEIDPDIASQLAILDNEKRAAVKEFIQGLGNADEPEPTKSWKPAKNGGKWTAEKRREHGEKIRRTKEANRAAQAEREALLQSAQAAQEE